MPKRKVQDSKKGTIELGKKNVCKIVGQIWLASKNAKIECSIIFILGKTVRSDCNFIGF